MTEAQNGMRDFDYSLMYKRERRRALEKRCSRQEVQYMQSQRKRKTRMKQLTTTGKVWRIMMSNEVGVRIRPQRALQILLKGSNSILKAYLYSPEKQTHKGVYTVDHWITQVWILWVHLHAVFFFFPIVNTAVSIIVCISRCGRYRGIIYTWGCLQFLYRITKQFIMKQ